MLEEGSHAPSFSRPGIHGDESKHFTLEEALADENAILLLFYPFDFSPVCTTELCAIRDAEWFQFTPDLEVWAMSADSTHAHRAFANEYRLNFPLLSDNQGRIAEAYDVCYEEWEGHESVPQRAVFLIDTDRTIRYAWHTEDAYIKPNFVPVEEAINELPSPHKPDTIEPPSLSIDYDEGPGQIE